MSSNERYILLLKISIYLDKRYLYTLLKHELTIIYNMWTFIFQASIFLLPFHLVCYTNIKVRKELYHIYILVVPFQQWDNWKPHLKLAADFTRCKECQKQDVELVAAMYSQVVSGSKVVNGIYDVIKKFFVVNSFLLLMR